MIASPNVKDLTVDVGVLMSGSKLGDPPNYRKSKLLMDVMMSIKDARLLMDDRGRINNQYSSKMVQGTVGHSWVRQMATKGKVVFVRWRRMDRGTTTKLKEAHFDPEDVKYVRTAAESSSKKLVSHDPDYSPSVQRVLKKRMSVQVLDANAASHFISR